jgi:hypothetical protein
MRRQGEQQRSRRHTGLCGLAAVTLSALVVAAPAGAEQLYRWGTDVGAEPHITPSLITGVSGISAVSAGGGGIYALTSGGPLGWGDNNYDQLLYGYPGPENCVNYCSRTPHAIGELAGVTQVSAGGDHGLALLEDGKVFAWGQDEKGQLGQGTLTGPETCSPPMGGVEPVQHQGVGSLRPG